MGKFEFIVMNVFGGIDIKLVCPPLSTVDWTVQTLISHNCWLSYRLIVLSVNRLIVIISLVHTNKEKQRQLDIKI